MIILNPVRYKLNHNTVNKRLQWLCHFGLTHICETILCNYRTIYMMFIMIQYVLDHKIAVNFK